MHRKHVTYNFYGQVGEKIYIYVKPVRTMMPQIDSLEIHACYEDQIGVTLLAILYLIWISCS